MVTLENLETPASPLRVDETGTVRVGNSRVTLDSLVAQYHLGVGPEEIALRFPTLSLPDVYASITFYLANRDRVDAYLAKRELQAAELKDKIQAERPQAGIRERLLARRATSNGQP